MHSLLHDCICMFLIDIIMSSKFVQSSLASGQAVCCIVQMDCPYSRASNDTSVIIKSYFVSSLRISILTPLCLLSSSATLSYFIHVVLMRECLGKHSCMSSPFPIATLNGTFFFSTVQLQVHTLYSERKTGNSLSSSKPESLNKTR